MSLTKKLLAASAVAAMLAVAGTANAAIVASSSGQESHTQDTVNFPTPAVSTTVGYCDFSPGCAGALTLSTSGGAAIQSGNTVNGAAPPGDGTPYMTVINGGIAALSAPIGTVFSTFSFFMGSPDTYNGLAFYNGATLVQSLTGVQFNGAPPNGDQQVGQRISIAFNGAQVNRVEFNSGATAFEFDRVIATVTPVPEVATWGMMILGMGMVGMGLRMRRRTAGAVA